MTSMIDVALAGSVGSADGLRLTPYEAMVQDLLFIRAELETAGIPFLLKTPKWQCIWHMRPRPGTR